MLLRTQKRYILRMVWQSLLVRKFSTFLTVLVIAVSLTIPTVGYLLWKNTEQALAQFYPEPELTVYLRKNLAEHEIDVVVAQLKQFERDKIEQLHYISRQESMEEFRRWSVSLGNALDILDDNPLPAVVVMKPIKAFRTTEHIQALREGIMNIKGVQEVRLDNDWIVKLGAINGLVINIALTGTLLMLLLVFLVISNSVRSDVASQQGMIQVMQQLGATDYFISLPFLYMSMLYGLLGGLLALLFSSLTLGYFAGMVRYVSDMFTAKFELLHFHVSEMLFIVVLAVFLGGVSALFATHRYIQKIGRA